MIVVVVISTMIATTISSAIVVVVVIEFGEIGIIALGITPLKIFCLAEFEQYKLAPEEHLV